MNLTRIRIRLHGGPPDLEGGLRTQVVAPEEAGDRVRVRFRAGWEHFEYAADEGFDEEGRPLRR